MIALPALLMAGLGPTEALATNKLQSSFGSGTAAITFIVKGYVHLTRMWFAIICTFIGASMGTLLVQTLDASFLFQLIPVLLILFAVYFFFSSKLSNAHSQQLISLPVFSLLVGFSIGFYDGFFGPGTGSFFALAFILLLGYNARMATGHTKVLNFTSNIAALIFFIIGGHVLWVVGLIMGAGQIIGASIGARLVIKNGVKLVRVMLITTSVAVSLSMIAGNSDHFIWLMFKSFLLS